MASPASLSRFRCTRCGDCCRKHRVPLTDSDLRRLREELGDIPHEAIEWLSPDDVDMTGEPETFVVTAEGRRLMVLAFRDSACLWLDETNGCTVYAGRPSACRTFPLELSMGRDGVRRLELLANADCRGAFDGSAQSSMPFYRIEERQRELRAYVNRVSAFNRRQRLLRLLGRKLETKNAFVDFLIGR